MTLPIIEAPVYSLTLPMNKKEIKIRPFLVKEEKILIIALASKEPTNISDAIIQIIDNCTFNKIDAKSLSLIDIEFILINLRSYSKGEEFEVNVKCKNVIDNEVCGHVSEYVRNISDIEIDIDNIIDPKIQLTENIGMKLQPPKVNLIKSISELKNNIDISEEGIAGCIESIWENDNVQYAKDQSMEDLVEFVSNLTSPQMEQIKKYIQSLPDIVVKIEHVCKKCGNKEVLTIKGIYDFLN